MLKIAKDLFSALNQSEVQYCHWKSNVGLSEELKGGELDIYVDKEDRTNFEILINKNNFIKISDHLQRHINDVFHYYGFDSETGNILHVHVFFSVISGESILKNYDFGRCSFLTSETDFIEDIPVPLKKNEAIVYLIRLAAKHSSILEYLLLKRDYSSIFDELKYLVGDYRSKNFILKDNVNYRHFIEEKDFKFLNYFFNTIINNKSFWVKFKASRKINLLLRDKNRFNATRGIIIRNILFFKLALRKLLKLKKTKLLLNSGFVIAFTGPEATGKSTLVESIVTWLGENFKVDSFHMGKPKPSIITIPFAFSAPLFKIIFANQKNTFAIKNKKQNKESKFIYSNKSVILALDRYRQSLKVFKKSKSGAIVVCDRWPSDEIGKMDSARIVPPISSSIKSRLIGFLSNIEKKYYKKVKNPDLIISLTVSPKTAVLRNSSRNKINKETSSYVLERHKKNMMPSFKFSNNKILNTDDSKNNSILEAKRIVWNQILRKNKIEE